MPNDETAYKICPRCIIDTTVPGNGLDNGRECGYCRLHDRMEKQFPLGKTGEERFRTLIREIKKSGKSRRYDCVTGLSGGRDSTYTLYLCKKLGLRPLAVHFNDGFGNPVAGENMKKAARILGVDLRTVTSDWRESKDLRVAFLKASVPEMEEGTDLGIATALYGTAAKERIKYVLIGQSFRTEGIAPLAWNYLDGKYLKSVHSRFGSIELKKWAAADPGFNLTLGQLFYYTVLRGIRTVPVLYYVDYVRKEAQGVIEKELGWVYTGAHYYDDLYQSLMNYVYRVKFNIDRRRFNYSALVRSGQMPRGEALERVKEVYVIEDAAVIELCLKRLGLSRREFEECLKQKPKTFRDYPTHYNLIRRLRPAIKLLSLANAVPRVVYSKYFECG